MRLLREDEVVPESGERVFRHGRLGPLALLVVIALPLAAAVAWRAPLAAALGALPWVAWLALVPIALVGVPLWLLCLHAAAQVSRCAFLPSSWLVRASPAGLLVKLRSYQNAHFDAGDPIVARFEWAELACARRVRELARENLSERSRVSRSSLELELSGNTDELARALAQERDRRGPRRSFLGMTGSARFGHVPVHVAGPRLVRVEWLGAGMLRALEGHLSVGEPRRVELASTPDEGSTADLDTRLRELCRRGQRFAALELARTERGLSLVDARRLVDDVGRESA